MMIYSESFYVTSYFSLMIHAPLKINPIPPISVVTEQSVSGVFLKTNT
jgi:hypothetical protein